MIRLLLSMPLLIVTPLFAQQRITGKVVADSGEALPGTSVMAKGTSAGTVTDDDGNYSLELSGEDPVLIFSFVGYLTQELPVHGQQRIDVTLVSDVTTLSDVVIVGYGTQKKVNVTGSVVSVGSEQIAGRGVTNLSNLLAGQTPGVTILQQGGNPGRNEGTIRIRGIGTLGGEAKNNPLILVDGIETSSLVEIDPNDVENVSILKDAAASAIYGVRAANGVILITTKRGKSGAPRISYGFQLGRSEAIMLPEKANAYELATLHNEANKNVGSPTLFKFSDLEKFQDGSSPLTHPDVNQVDAVISEPAIRQTHNLGLSGGTDAIQYNVMFNYTKEGGLMLNTGHDRYTIRLNLDQRITEKLTAGVNFSASVRDITDPIDGVDGILHRAYREWATDNTQFPDGRWAYPAYSGLDHNAVAYSHDRGSKSTEDVRLMGTVFAEYEVLKGLKIKGIAANVRDYNSSTAWQRAVDLYRIDLLTGLINDTADPSHPAVTSAISKERFTRSDINLQAMLTYERTFRDHYVKGLAGFNQRKEISENLSLSRRGLNPQLDQVNGASSNPEDATTGGNTTDYRLRSGFARVNYAYRERYLFEGNIRYDGTSRFPRQNRFHAFPSLSAGWRISEESFFHVPSVASLKLRASWGQLGNQEIGNYAFINTVDFNSTSAIIGGEQVSGANESFQLANETIRWETTTMSNAGLDAELFEGKLTFSADYFNKRTDDILLTVEQPRILGATAPLANAGSLKNIGVEITVGFKNHLGDVRYGVQANFSHIKNTILDLGGEDVKIVDDFRYEKGKSASNIYGFVAEGLFRNQADVQEHADQSSLGGLTQAGDIRYKDIVGDGFITNDDRRDLGSYFPSITYGVTLNASYKNVDLSMVWQGVGEVDAYVTGRLARPFELSNSPLAIQYRDRAQVSDDGELINPDAKFPRTLFSNPNNYTGEVADGRANSFFVKSAAYLKLRNVQLGYTLPKAIAGKCRVQHLRAYLSCENLLTISKFNYYQVDPEIPSTGDPVPTYPTVRSYLVGVNVTF